MATTTDAHEQSSASPASEGWQPDVTPVPMAVPTFGKRTVKRFVKADLVSLTVNEPLDEHGRGVAKDRDNFPYLLNRGTEGAAELRKGQRFKARVTAGNYVVQALAES